MIFYIIYVFFAFDIIITVFKGTPTDSPPSLNCEQCKYKFYCSEYSV